MNYDMLYIYIYWQNVNALFISAPSVKVWNIIPIKLPQMNGLWRVHGIPLSSHLCDPFQMLLS